MFRHFTKTILMQDLANFGENVNLLNYHFHRRVDSWTYSSFFKNSSPYFQLSFSKWLLLSPITRSTDLLMTLYVRHSFLFCNHFSLSWIKYTISSIQLDFLITTISTSLLYILPIVSRISFVWECVYWRKGNVWHMDIAVTCNGQQGILYSLSHFVFNLSWSFCAAAQ